jgi:hypothetical protein
MSQPPQPTRSLKQFEILIGTWEMVGTHPALPEPVKGEASFEWLRDGALLVWHFNPASGSGVPKGYSVIGHDDAGEACSMLYTDERGVHRIYQMTLAGGIWKQWRNSADFAQRMTGTFSANGNTISVAGEMSMAGAAWEPDLNMTYRRKK